MKMNILCWAVLLLCLKILSVKAEPSVHILAENLEQLVTSSTLEWVPSRGNDEDILKNAVIAAYQSVEDSKESKSNENEENSGNTTSNRPVHICRVNINSVWISGQLRVEKYVCVVSIDGNVAERLQFEILVNTNGTARLDWVYRNKYTIILQGAVMTGEIYRGEYFLARRKANNSPLSHNIGHFAPSEHLGVFHLVDQNNHELQFDDGEVLVETEPVRYELKSVQFNRSRDLFPRKQIELGLTTLRNQVNSSQRVTRVIEYTYNDSLFWGKGHGLLTGLPFSVFIPNGSHIQGNWAIPQKKEKLGVIRCAKYLDKGTGVNIILLGNCIESETPYNATVVLIYKDGVKREIMIRDTKTEKTIRGVFVSYSPVYFLHNDHYVLTTTTATTATTKMYTSVAVNLNGASLNNILNLVTVLIVSLAIRSVT